MSSPDESAHAASLAEADAHARERALDVRESWLVQAPAGSGKTELLVQRVLALLAHVDVPERVVATTFTIKAAEEMRARVMGALRDARDARVGTAAVSPHRAQTLSLAREVLAQDQRRQWRLLEFPARLDIGTLDRLALRIASQLPVSSTMGGIPKIEENADVLYRAAALHAIESAPADDVAWQTLIAHFDNDGGRVVDLLVSMLARRDQWMPPLISLRDAEVRQALERTLAEEVERSLVDLCERWPRNCVDDLVPLARYARETLADDAMLGELDSRNGLPAPTVESLAHWQRLADWLLTQKGEFPGGNKLPQGFPAIASGGGASRRREMNDRIRTWFETTSRTPGLTKALHRARLLPKPEYSRRAKAFIDALVHVLPLAAARLLVVFGAENACDFSEVTLRALQALGNEDDPSPVLLAQDVRIEHLLIDEFQDTSQRQLQLIEKLTSGWQPGDGRTLFVVGDPMQSIYAFREAEVRNFLDAARSGVVGGVAVGKLALGRNFRSQANLVAHVNATFPQVLETVASHASAAVGFGAAVAVVPATKDVPTFELAQDARDEAARVVTHVEHALADGLSDVAILVRARSHVGDILQRLRDRGIAYDAVKLDSLAERPLSRDLLWLARALSQPADRLAWFSVLRAPWCALTLPDLLRFADASTDLSPGHLLANEAVRAGLSHDGSDRLHRIGAIVARTQDLRHLPLVTRTRSAWLALDGPACYGRDPSNVVAADAMFALIARHDRGGDIDDWDALQDDAASLRADAPVANDVKVKVMTLHAAKGLEFDAIVLPGLARNARADATGLLRWRARAGDRALLIGTPRAQDEDEADPIDAWLKSLDDADAAAEVARLLYVGFTRARRRLHLTGVGVAGVDRKSGKVHWKRPRKNSSLAMLWHAIAGDANEATITVHSTMDSDRPPAPPLLRLPAAYDRVGKMIDLPAPPSIDAATDMLVYDWAQADAAAVGTVVHRILAGLPSAQTPSPGVANLASLRPRIEVELASLGVVARRDDRPGEDATTRVLQAVGNAIDDPQGRWLFACTHTGVHAEWALTSAGESGIERIAIDRSFVADGMRWIVDFKTSRHQGGDVDAFLSTEQARHGPQLERYARVLRRQEDLPVMLALYYPALRRLRSWRFGE